MVTFVGKQTNFIEAVKELVELDLDAIEAYRTAHRNLKDPEYIKKFSEFEEDHERHVKELSEFLKKAGETAPTAPDNTKSFLAKGKVALASLFGDDKILMAMSSNEDDTNTAYERMSARIHESSDPEIGKIITRGLEDEKKHKRWMESMISKN